jgi:Zn-dependent M16 (insulinase) family peptidase
LTRSSNLVKAYQVAKEVIDDLIAKKMDFEDVKLESAKSGVIFSIVSREETVDSAALQVYM